MTHILLLDETDCGAACLAMVARHHRGRYSLTTFREMAGTDRQGMNLAGLVKAVQSLGFDTKALKGMPEATTPEPIVPRGADSSPHFGRKKCQNHSGGPRCGRRHGSHRTFADP